MKSLLLTLIVLATSQVFAQDSGLSCTMKYSSNDLLVASTVSSGAWLVAGDEMSGKTVVWDGDGQFRESAPAHYIQVSEMKQEGENMWLIKVLNGEKSLIGTFGFLKKEGMRATLPVRAFADEEEDPQEYNQLEVTCSFTYFAG